ncbi:MAG: DNA repair protein RecN [Halioglobus sp.]|nr:DNA repair protein RecN [Halioglobus sp.]
MLSQLSISNYTVIASLEMAFSPGMTVITGETGAGKSIMLDALGLCVGDRADPKAIRHRCDKAEVIASFDLTNIPQALTWLNKRDLEAGTECVLRRVIGRDGRSRAYINGSLCTLQDCAELGAMLIDIHSQHSHQSLLRKTVQRDLLDVYAGHLDLTQTIEQCASEWLHKHHELELIAGSSEEHANRIQLLTYQVEELDTLDLQPTELSALEQEHRLLANAERILDSAQEALTVAEAQESGVQQALRLLDEELHATDTARDARALLESAAIQITEARSEIQQHLSSVEVDPARLAQVQRRLEDVYDIARKHRVVPEQLTALHQSLREELTGLAGGGERINELQRDMDRLEKQYTADAKTLSRQRKAAGRKLVKQSKTVLDSLAMAGCEFEVALIPVKGEQPHPHGGEDIEFRISTNPGNAPRPLRKIASGGELSRISLAIGVVTAGASTIPAMVFDEVDVGIGGAVAEVVGKLLRTLATQAQVLCVTHLPQVAAEGNHHLQVTKSRSGTHVETGLRTLHAAEEKVKEIARMLGGVKITPQTLATAREMLEG